MHDFSGQLLTGEKENRVDEVVRLLRQNGFDGPQALAQCVHHG